MPTRTKNSSQHVLTKPFPSLRGHKIYINLCWTNPSLDCEGTKLCKTNPSHETRERKMHLKLCGRKPSRYLQGHKMYLNVCWSNQSHENEEHKMYHSLRWQNPPMTARTQNASQLELSMPEGNKECLNMCWHKLHVYLWFQNHSHTSEVTKSNSH